MDDVLKFLRDNKYCIIDKKGIFLYFYNEKTGLQSIVRSYPLKDRALIRKDSPTGYKIAASQMTYQDFMKRIKFTIVRNPWDKVVSAFYYHKNIAKATILKSSDFKTFVKTELKKYGPEIDPHFHEQYNRVVYEGRIIVDYILRFERLQDDWNRIASILHCRPDLPHKYKTDHLVYQKHYDAESEAIIRKMYQRDIQFFGYEF